MRRALALPRMREFAPTGYVQFNIEFGGSVFDALPSFVALGIRHAFDLVESSDGIAHMGGIVQRLFTLFGKSEIGGRYVLAFFFVNLAHGSYLLYRY